MQARGTPDHSPQGRNASRLEEMTPALRDIQSEGGNRLCFREPKSDGRGTAAILREALVPSAP